MDFVNSFDMLLMDWVECVGKNINFKVRLVIL